MTQQIKMLLAIFSVLLGMSTAAIADESYNSSRELTTLSGQVTFERHATLIPMICELGSACPSRARSKAYWSLVVNSGGVRYELAQPVSFEALRAPEGFELDGVYIHDGDEITLLGIVETFTNDYGVISEVESVSVPQ